MGGPYRGKLLDFGESVLAELGKGSGNRAPKLADRWNSAVWLGKSDLTDEHLVRTDDRVVEARSIRRLVEHSWSCEKPACSCRNTTEAEGDDIGHPSCS